MQISIATYWQLLRQYLAPQRQAVWSMAMLLFASIAVQLLVPQVARNFINGALAGVSEGALVRTALLFIAISAIHQLLRVLATYWSERVAWQATNALRLHLTAHLLGLDLDFHQNHAPGELIERVDGDVNVLAGLFSAVVIQLIGNALLLLGIVVALALVDWRLGLAFFVFAVVTMILLLWIRRFGRHDWQRSRQQSAAYYGLLGELIAASEDLRSSGAVPHAMNRFFAQLRPWFPVQHWADIWSCAIWMTAILLFGLGDTIAYGLSGWLFLGGAIQLGTVYMIVAYTAMLAAPIETIRTQLQDLQRADAAIVRIHELLGIHSKLKDGNKLLPSGALGIECREVSFTYEDEEGEESHEDEVELRLPTLQNITFHLQAGRVLGVLGRTGSGKSTLARLFFRLLDPQAGEVRVGGIDLRHAQINALRTRIGFVTQDVQLFEATLRDNITCFAPNIADTHLFEVMEMLGLGGWLARLSNGLDTPISTTTLSAGEAQLVALARVFLKDPGLIILDEASSRLDPATEALLEQALDRLLEGRTAVIIAHRLATLDRATDLLVLENGRIIEFGPRQQLINNSDSHFTRLRYATTEEVLA